MLALDITSKTIVVATLSSRAPERLLGGLLTLVETRNPGAAFNLGGPSETVIFSLIAVGVVAFIVRSAHRIYSVAWAVALGLLLGGATGNLTDRIFRAPGLFRGWVVDWIELPHWPVFNLADSAITCGGVLMVVLAVAGHGIEGKPRPAGAAATEPAGPAEQPGQPGQPGAVPLVPGEPRPDQAAAEPSAPAEPVRDQAGTEESGQPDPEQTQPAQDRPQWPEPDQPRSQWPRSGWSEPEQPKHEHPTRGSGG